MLDTRQYRDANIADDSRRPAEDDARTRAAHLAEGEPRRIGRDVEGDRLERPDVDPDGVPGEWRARRLGELHGAVGLRAGAAGHPALHGGRAEFVNTLWITTDVHFAEAFRYRPFPANPAFVVHELASGPLNAGIFPTAAFDTTLNPTVLFGPRPPTTVATWEQAKDGFNFGTVEVDSRGRLTAGFVNTAGQNLYSLTLTPQ